VEGIFASSGVVPATPPRFLSYEGYSGDDEGNLFGRC